MTDFLSMVSEAERNLFTTLSQLSENDVDNIWSNVSTFVERQMTLQKGVYIAGLGTFTFSQQKLDVGNKFVLMQRPIFLLAEKLAQAHGLKQVKPLSAAGDVPLVQLNFTALSVESPFERGVVEGCVRETLLLLLRAVATGRSALLTFRGIGELSFCQSKVKMKFYRDFVRNMDGSGRLLWALSNRPGTSNSILSGRLSSNQQPGPSNTITFPRIPPEQPGKDRGEDAPGQKQGNECPVTPRPRTRQTVDLAKVSGISLPDDLEPRPRAESKTDRHTVSILPLEGAVKEKEEMSRYSFLDMPCITHTRAGQELCYLCMQRAQRNIPVYLSEERLREEQEQERSLLLNEQRRDQYYLQREQADRLEIRENNQKVAAFNLGVSEAMKERKAARSSQFQVSSPEMTSYIFEGRPLTPPGLPKQCHYLQDLQAQAEWRMKKMKQTQQDQELIDRLHQVQLAQEIAQQKAQQIRQKQKNISCYQKALDKQVENQGPGLPARQPDSDGPIFGRPDCTPAGLAEQRQRAERVYQEQLATTNHKRQMELLNHSARLRSERDMLNQNKKELIEDRIDRFCKLRNLRASLEDTWSRSAELKRQRDLEEREFIRSGSGLLVDQCERFRRCYQCKRNTANCGQSNIWKESRYIPGSRLMV
ncbi:coiled-coil domain-containing protein 81 isoform X2 [Esox lucius]|uniref:coiled-coil domain-containing protein 81 isoform X2 n=1 Tax=Esox lucius TaxID=8010 RepID=UPI0014777BED|nr:coiled-coil domain-containing protein 81 isoform X2 [Esox lucius]